MSNLTNQLVGFVMFTCAKILNGLKFYIVIVLNIYFLFSFSFCKIEIILFDDIVYI